MIEGGKEMEEINLESLIESIWSRKIWIIIIVCISLIIGWYYSYFMITPEYQSFTTLLLAQNTTNSDGTSGQITQTDITLNQKLISTYSALIKTKDVLEQVIQNLEIDITQEELKNNISVMAIFGRESYNKLIEGVRLSNKTTGGDSYEEKDDGIIDSDDVDGIRSAGSCGCGECHEEDER